MKKIATSLPGLLLLEPRVFGDDRGFFLESYNQRAFAELGIPEPFVQDNHSYSEKNVIRGLHYQIRQPQGKLVRAITGEILDVPLAPPGPRKLPGAARPLFERGADVHGGDPRLPLVAFADAVGAGLGEQQRLVS